MVVNKPFHSSMEKEIKKAANIINAFFDSTVDADSSIPVELIRNCMGLAFLTVVKAGFIWSGKLGTGIVITRLEDGSWSPPSAIGTAGVGFGAEIGGEIIDFMIVLGTESAVKTFKKGTQVSVGAGFDVAIGPVGRAAGANINASGGGISNNYTYSHAKGMFAGVGLHGSTILVRGDMNTKFYGREVKPMEILNGYVQAPEGSCDVLYDAIQRAQMSGTSDSMSRQSSMYAGSSASSFGASTAAATRHSISAAPSSTSTSSSYGRSSSFDRPSSTSAPPQPIENDPRLRRYTSYKSERDMYAQFAQQKAAGGAAAATSSTSPYAAPAASINSYTQQQPAASTYQSQYSQPPPAYQQQPAAAAAPAPKVTYIPASAYAPIPSSSSSSSSFAAPASTPTPPPVLPPAPTPAPKKVTYIPASAYTLPPSSGSSSSAPRKSSTPMPPMPSPATGSETKEVYTKVIEFVSTRCPHVKVQVFKDNCRLFGQDGMSLDAFFAYLTSICTNSLMRELVPQLVRLLPTPDKRERLWVCEPNSIAEKHCSFADAMASQVPILSKCISVATLQSLGESSENEAGLRNNRQSIRMALILTQEEIDACRESFVHFDKDGSGTIDKYELAKVLEAMGQKPTDEELFQMIAEVDNDHSGEIEFAEFLKVIEAQKIRAAQYDDESDFIDAFVACGGNPDKSGHVERKMLVQLIKKDFGLPIDIDRMIDELDTDGSGELEYDEFKNLLS
ncbi:TPA: hypothetical protein N0F65_009920 [Lagenidium giganteum]|uniref:EF-hand domain-containing protein n=1 Tax=Lagenidium giganteum TaxID=4803 RepID=A0AAV2YIY5_9STRA|nr:TPA: hypothetical protein N0F65_009920 [Lagenidium giganteum]